MPKLDKLIEDLLFAHLAENAPDDAQENDRADETDPEAIQLAETQESMRKLRMGYAAVPRTVSDDTMFSVLPQLEATERDLKAKLRKRPRYVWGGFPLRRRRKKCAANGTKPMITWYAARSFPAT